MAHVFLKITEDIILNMLFNIYYVVVIPIINIYILYILNVNNEIIHAFLFFPSLFFLHKYGNFYFKSVSKMNKYIIILIPTIILFIFIFLLIM